MDTKIYNIHRKLKFSGIKTNDDAHLNNEIRRSFLTDRSKPDIQWSGLCARHPSNKNVSGSVQ